MKRLPFILLLLAGCKGSAPVGAACTGNKDCATNICLSDVFPGGYCTHDCTDTACPEGETCHIVGPYQVCLHACTEAADCREGYHCHQGGCRPPCSGDEECGQGFVCADGACMEKPGTPVGGACVLNEDCSSQVCLEEKCVQGCDHDSACPSTQTCYINPYGDIRAKPTTHLIPICVDRRGTGAPGATCAEDSECDRGSCQLGMCTEMCATGGDCTRAGTGCTTLVAVVDNHSGPTFKGCLPTKGMVELDGKDEELPLPATAQSFAIYTHVEPFDFNLAVGITSLKDPMMTEIYTQPQTEQEFYDLPIRYIPTEGSSTMLVPNSPRVTLMAGLYRFNAATSAGQIPSSRIYIKLGSAPFTGGTAPLNIYYTDLTNSCHPLTFNQVKGGSLQSPLNTVANIYAQAGVSFSSINYIDVSATVANTIRVANNPANAVPDLENVLLAATSDRPGLVAGFDVVLLRSITNENGGQSGVLGIAGGIPSNPVLGTAHSGVAVAISTLCFANNQTFGSTIAHELGHSTGLFHNIEMDGKRDPLTDTGSDGDSNLMYWLENSGENLSAQQSTVVRNDPKVKQ